MVFIKPLEYIGRQYLISTGCAHCLEDMILWLYIFYHNNSLLTTYSKTTSKTTQ